MIYPAPITELPNNGIKVLLMRRTTNDTVKTAVGYRDARGELRGWYASAGLSVHDHRCLQQRIDADRRKRA